MADYQFKYSPLTGRLTGNQMIEQTEQAINALASQVDSAAGQVEIISTLANEANENAATALETAEEALATTGRTYITVSTQTDANNYYDSQLIYIADSTSTNIPVADTGMLEVKTNDNKTACEQVFISDSSGDAYYRNGAITAETVGDVTTYTVTWGGWSSHPASQQYVQEELVNYLPLSGGTVTGGLTVEGGITGNLAGNADTATNATNDANGNPIASTYLPLAGGTMSGAIKWDGLSSSNKFYAGFTEGDGSRDIGWASTSHGAKIALRSADYDRDGTASVGEFIIIADNGTNEKNLCGRVNGSLLWDSKEVERVNASGSNYIRYESGLQICWGHTGNKTATAGSTSQVVTFPVAFKNSDYAVSVTSRYVSGSWTNNTTLINGNTTTSVELFLQNITSSAYTFYFVWMAVGYWK